MARSQTTLKDELVAMGLFGDEADAIDAWTAAWSAYFEDAETNGIPVTPAALPSAEAQMDTAMAGMSEEDKGAQRIQDGITAWWSAMTAAPASFFSGCIAISPPPGLPGIASALQSAFDSNRDGEVTAEQAYQAISAVLHPANVGGQATFPGAPPLVFPIL
jgi:hypothetical protein